MFFIETESLKELQAYANKAMTLDDLTGNALQWLYIIIDMLSNEDDTTYTENSAKVIDFIEKYEQLA